MLRVLSRAGNTPNKRQLSSASALGPDSNADKGLFRCGERSWCVFLFAALQPYLIGSRRIGRFTSLESLYQHHVPALRLETIILFPKSSALFRPNLAMWTSRMLKICKKVHPTRQTTGEGSVCTTRLLNCTAQLLLHALHPAELRYLSLGCERHVLRPCLFLSLLCSRAESTQGMSRHSASGCEVTADEAGVANR